MVIVRNKIIRLKQFKLIVQMFVFIREYKNRISVLIVCLQYISKKLVGFIGGPKTTPKYNLTQFSLHYL